MVPVALHELSVGFVALGTACFAIIAIDVSRHPQQMWIMDAVWPLTALFGTALIVWQYFPTVGWPPASALAWQGNGTRSRRTSGSRPFR